jgi:hypothetical protein
MRELAIRATLLAAIGCVFCVVSVSRAEEADAFSAADLEFFEKEIRPLLAERCFECHGPDVDKPKGSLRLDSRQSLLAGGDTGAAITPGKPEESLLIDSVNYGDTYQMPPRSKLPETEIAALTKWVAMGAPWPAPAASERNAKEEFSLSERKESHWAWKPLAAPTIPDVMGVTGRSPWEQSPIDRFILAKLHEHGLSPAPEADAPALLRRLYLDLTGQPPPAEEVEALLSLAGEARREAYERTVDRLLASPAFGERFARHWLDLVRYAESRGHEFDHDAANAWQYRDYVIRAIDCDLPYDRFVIEHVAGDLVETPRTNSVGGFNESILATGFWHLGEWVHSPVDIRQDETDRFDNMVDVFSKAFLGLTVACARCHDHKFDAISQADYYALTGYLQSSEYRQARFDTMGQHRQVARELARLEATHRRPILAALGERLRPALDRMGDYLLAAAGAMERAAGEAEIPHMAAERGLSADRLREWTDLVRHARSAPNDPLYAFASAGGIGAEEGAKADGRIIIDYASAPLEDFLSDGPTFGIGPVRPGDLILPKGEDSRLLVFAEHGSARRDGRWNGLKLASGVQGDAGKLAGIDRAGKTLRTPTFTLETGKLHYLVRGAGYAYVVVDSHRMVAGPLHGELWRQFDHGHRPKWAPHDLSAYRGHNAHIEFIVQGDRELEVLKVIEAEAPPAEAAQTFSLIDARGQSLNDLARDYETTFRETVDLASRGELSQAPDAGDRAAIMNWLLENEEQFLGKRAADDALDRLVTSFGQAESAIMAGVQWESRTAMAMWDGSGLDDRLLIRGNTKTPGPAVPRGMLEAIAGPRQACDERGSGRMELARSLVDPANPFTSRVIVNRVWHHLLGQGLAPSVDNFGVLGQPPTHPELLDYLANDFMQSGWSIKRLVREIVTSSVYQMSSRATAADAADPTNAWLHKARLKRLEAEAIRDSLLAVSGRLDRTRFGPSVPVHLTPFMQGRGRPAQSGPLDGDGRRSIYQAVRRNFLSPMMLAFDAPIPLGPVGRRNVSNVPAQALIMLNDPLVIEQARLWAKEVLRGDEKEFAARLRKMYLTALGRLPAAEELSKAEAFLESQGEQYGLSAEAAGDDVRVWTDLCHVLFNAKEFIFVN